MVKNEMISLGLIYAEPAHAYALDAFIRDMNFDQWTNISRASIYNTLKRLEAEGCVTASTEKPGNMPERRVYGITEKGKQRLLAELRESMQPSLISSDSFTLAMFFCFGMSADEAIELLKKRIDKLKGEIEKMKADYGEIEKYKVYHAMIQFNAGLKHMEAEVETAQEYIKLFKEFPNYYNENVSQMYKFMMQRYK